MVAGHGRIVVYQKGFSRSILTCARVLQRGTRVARLCPYSQDHPLYSPTPLYSVAEKGSDDGVPCRVAS
jgi:hypothetical protein